MGTAEHPGGGFIHAPGAAASGARGIFNRGAVHHAEPVLGVESTAAELQVRTLTWRSRPAAINKIPVESFVKETVSAAGPPNHHTPHITPLIHAFPPVHTT
jgi:hypothetical protein